MAATAKVLSTEISNGKIKAFKGVERIYYDGKRIRSQVVSNPVAVIVDAFYTLEGFNLAVRYFSR